MDLLNIQESLTIIGGDSGVGKTRVLEEVVALFDGIAPAPVAVGHAPAALQVGLLDALGAAAALIAEEESTARRVGKVLVEGGRRLASAKASEIGMAVARIVLGVVRDRVGPDVTDVIIDYLEQVRVAAADDVVARIRQAGDPDVIHAIASLAADVAAVAGGRKILLPLENIDRLQPDDRGRLMDLGPLLPHGVSVLCAYTSDSGEDEVILDQYIRADIIVYPLLGLEAWAVKQWLCAEGLSGDMTEQVTRTTNGYGLAIASAVQLLKAGQSLTAATSNGGREEILRAATRQALRGLDVATYAAALKLSVLADPLPARYAAAYLDLDPAAWAATEGLLIDNHIFVPGNPPWFHDQRRRLLRQQVPSDALPAYLQAAAAQLSAMTDADSAVSADTFMQYAEINDTLLRLGVANAAITAVAQLSDCALAVLGSIIELTDAGSPGLDGEQLLLYARDIYLSGEDQSAALRELREAALTATASDEYQTIVVASLGSRGALLYAIGKIGSRLGRVPIPGIASLIFNGRLRGALGQFVAARYGVGEPSLGELSKDSVRPRGRYPHTQPPLARRNQPHLLIRGLFGDVPFFTAVAYQHPPDRDRALTELRTLPAYELLGHRVLLSVVAAQPDVPLPPRRLVCAFERAFGFPIGNISNSFDPVIQGEEVPRDEAVGQQLAALNLLAELSSELERQVTGYEAGRYGLLRWVSTDGSGEMTAVVANASGIIHLKDVPEEVLRRFDRVQLGQLAGLELGQRIGRAQYRAGPQSRVTDLQLAVNEVTQRARKIMAFNEQQPRRRIPAEVDHLQALIQEQLDERETMARRIADRFGREFPPGHDIYVLVDPHIHDPGMIPWAGRDATVVLTKMRGASPQVFISIEPTEEQFSSLDSLDRLAAQVETTFGVRGVTPSRAHNSSALDAVSRLLGHMFNDILLT